MLVFIYLNCLLVIIYSGIILFVNYPPDILKHNTNFSDVTLLFEQWIIFKNLQFNSFVLENINFNLLLFWAYKRVMHIVGLWVFIFRYFKLFQLSQIFTCGLSDLLLLAVGSLVVFVLREYILKVHILISSEHKLCQIV
jgi:hypothetical protein